MTKSGALKNMENLFARLAELQGRVFEQLFKTAEIAKFEPEELRDYEQSIYAYRGIVNGMDTAKRDGMAPYRAHIARQRHGPGTGVASDGASPGGPMSVGYGTILHIKAPNDRCRPGLL